MGFDNECIVNIQSLPGEYFCPVCRTLVYPHEGLQSQCTHLYCKPCLAYIVATTQACPYDGYLVTEADSKPLLESNKVLAETIGKVPVHCLFHRSGCQWLGTLSECNTHCTDCSFGNSVVVCNRCGVQIFHRQVQEHAQSCPGLQPQGQQAEAVQAAVNQSATPLASAVAASAPVAPLSIVPASTVGTLPVPSAVPVAAGPVQNQANTGAVQAQGVAQPVTADQWYQQQLQYQQYLQQYPGYNPYQQQYQQIGPYQQQGYQQYPQAYAQVPAQQAYQGQQPYIVAQQVQPQSQAPTQSVTQPQLHMQPQAQLLPQAQAQIPQQVPQHQPQPHPQPQPQPQPQTLHQLPSQPQQPLVPQSQLQPQSQGPLPMQAQSTLTPQQHSFQSQPQTFPPPQSHVSGQQIMQSQSQPNHPLYQPIHQAAPQPHHQQNVPQHHPFPHAPVSNANIQHQLPVQPQLQSQAQVLPQPPPPPRPQSHPQTQPILQQQMQHTSVQGVTGYHSFPQPQTFPQQPPNVPHQRPQAPGLVQSQFPVQQPHPMRPPQAQLPVQQSQQQPPIMPPQGLRPPYQQGPHSVVQAGGQPVHHAGMRPPPQQQSLVQQQVGGVLSGHPHQQVIYPSQSMMHPQQSLRPPSQPNIPQHNIPQHQQQLQTHQSIQSTQGPVSHQVHSPAAKSLAHQVAPQQTYQQGHTGPSVKSSATVQQQPQISLSSSQDDGGRSLKPDTELTAKVRDGSKANDSVSTEKEENAMVTCKSGVQNSKEQETVIKAESDQVSMEASEIPGKNDATKNLGGRESQDLGDRGHHTKSCTDDKESVFQEGEANSKSDKQAKEGLDGAGIPLVDSNLVPQRGSSGFGVEKSEQGIGVQVQVKENINYMQTQQMPPPNILRDQPHLQAHQNMVPDHESPFPLAITHDRNRQGMAVDKFHNIPSTELNTAVEGYPQSHILSGNVSIPGPVMMGQRPLVPERIVPHLIPQGQERLLQEPPFNQMQLHGKPMPQSGIHGSGLQNPITGISVPPPGPPGLPGQPPRGFEQQALPPQGNIHNVIPSFDAGAKFPLGAPLPPLAIRGPPPGGISTPSGMMLRGPAPGPDPVGLLRPPNFLEAETYPLKRPEYSDVRYPEIPPGLPLEGQPNAMKINGFLGQGPGIGMQDSVRPYGAVDDRFRPLPDERFNSFTEGYRGTQEEQQFRLPLHDSGISLVSHRGFEEDLKQFPRPAHLDGEGKQKFGTHVPSSRFLDRAPNPFGLNPSPRSIERAPFVTDGGSGGPFSKPFPVYQPGSKFPMNTGGPEPFNADSIGERHNSFGLNDNMPMKPDLIDSHLDSIRPVSEFGRNPFDEYPPPRGTSGGHPGLPFSKYRSPRRERLGLDERGFNAPMDAPGTGSVFSESRIPNHVGPGSNMMPPHLLRGGPDGPDNTLLDGSEISRGHFHGSEPLGPGFLGTLRTSEAFSDQNISSFPRGRDSFGRDHLIKGEPTGFGLSSHPRPGPVNLPSHLSAGGQVSDANLPGPMHRGDLSFGSSFSGHGPTFDERDSFENSRKRKPGSMGWCRICKIDCETIEGLELHSQTREHQKMAVDIVLSIKRDSTKFAKKARDNLMFEDSILPKQMEYENRGKR